MEENDSYIYFSGATHVSTTEECKIASFDLDHTLICPSSGRKFPQNENDWRWLFLNVQDKINQYKANGYTCVIFTNQSNVKDHIRTKIAHLTQLLGVYALVSKTHDHNRKPDTGMWETFLRLNGIQSIHKDSFYCGDACGRPSDFSDSDLKFAINLGICFYHPEVVFKGEPETTYQLLNQIPPLATAEYEMELFEKPLTENKSLRIVFMIGPPASGKSSFSRHPVFGEYVVVNKDTLKTELKCIKKIKEAVEAGKNIIVDNTNPSAEGRQKYLYLVDNRYVKIAVYFKIPNIHAMHNAHYRQLTDPSAKHIPAVVYHTYSSRLDEPTTPSEFDEIIQITQLSSAYVANTSLYKRHYL